MNSINHIMYKSSIEQEIEQHIAWLGHVSGLEAEKLLRGRKVPYLYVLRSGEIDSGNKKDYYVTFINSDLTVKHQPFVITVAAEGWYYENGAGGGPYKDSSINDVLHLIMHCSKESCIPLIPFEPQ